MKWNWGKGLVAGMLSFMIFILYLVITMSTDKKYSHDLVTDEYYAKEIVYQKEIDSEQNLQLLSASIRGEQTDKGWLLHFPSEITSQNSKGTVSLYRPSNQKLDFDFPMVVKKSQLLISHARLIEGRWDIKIQWETEGTPYMYKESIHY